MRQLQTGRAYGLPPPAPGISPDSVGTLDEWRQVVTASADQVSQNLVSHALSHGTCLWRGTCYHCAAQTPSANHPHKTLSCVQVAEGNAAIRPGQASSLRNGCVRAFQGVSPTLVEELCARAEVDISSSPAQLTDDQWERLYGAWHHWLESLQHGRFQPSLDSQTGRLSVLGSYAEHREAGVHAAVEDLFQSSQQVGPRR